MSAFSGVVAIVAPHFTAGIMIDCNRIKKAPPWLRYMECWTVEQLQKFVRDQHWKMVELERYVRLGDFATSSARYRGEMQANQIASVIQSKVSLFWIDNFIGIMTCDDLKFVMQWHIRDQINWAANEV
jgi:hypothetical protein